jgi:hypothetical protein
MSDKEQLELLRSLLLLMIQHQESTMALTMTLKAEGLLSPELFQKAMTESQNFWTTAREKVEKIGTKEAPSLLDILKSFEGPLQ